jgi:hypothetical protein
VNLPEPYARPTPASVIRITRQSGDAGRRRGDSKSHPRCPKPGSPEHPGRFSMKGFFIWSRRRRSCRGNESRGGRSTAAHAALLTACAPCRVESRTRPARSRRQRRMRHTRSPCSVSGRMDRRRSLGNLPASRRCPHQQLKWRSVPGGTSQPWCLFRILDPAEPSVAWLKNREINALKSP